MDSNAMAHLKEALSALTTEGFRYDPATGSETALDPVACTIAMDLERVDAAIGPRGGSMFFPIAENIKSAVIEIVAAMKCLEGKNG